MAVTKEALAIVLDIGESSDKILVEAKRCISMIVQRKIFSESKDEIALILFGPSDKDTNDIIVVQELRLANWELLKSISEVKSTNIPADDIRDKALLTAISVLQNTFIGKKFFSRRILFLSCFDGYIYSSKVDEICEELKKQKIDLNVIGPVAFPAEGIKNRPFNKGYVTLPEKHLHCITKILKEVNGKSYSFSDVLPALIDFQKKKVQPIPWNANLDIGTNLSIPISAYIKVCENKPKPWKEAYAFKPNAKITRGTSYFNEFQTTLTIIDGFPCLRRDVSDIFTSGYKYGTTLVPCSEQDKANMDYQSGEKGMKVLGFTKAENVQRYHYMGYKTMYVFGQKNRELAGVILAPFIHALNETNMVAIVRYVYSPKSAPKIGFLTPKIKENYECLIFVALPFMEDLRHLQLKPLGSDPKNVPTERQLSAVDELITAMDLTDPVSCEDEEILKPKNTVNPYLQHLYECLEFKSLKPEKPLLGVEPHIEALVTPDPKLLKRAGPSLRKIRALFPTKQLQSEICYRPFPYRKTEEEHRKELMDSVRIEKPLSDDPDRVVEVGSVNPVRDFQYMINNKVLPFNDICQQLMDVVVKFLQDNAHLRMYHSKILSMCKEFRSAALKTPKNGELITCDKLYNDNMQNPEGNPVKYNCFMKNLRNVLLECDEELWSKVKNEKIGLISKSEIPTCKVSVEQAEMFLANQPHSAEKSAVTLIESFDVNDEYGKLVSSCNEYGNEYGDLLDQL